MKSNLVLKLILFLILTFTLISEIGFAQLTGAWKDDNGATYCIKQAGNHVFWYMEDRPRVHNVFYGVVAGEYLTGQWADLPGGQLNGNATLSLRIESDSRMVKVGQTSNYRGSVWTRVNDNLCAKTKAPIPELGGDWKYSNDPSYTITQNGRYLILEHKKTNWLVNARIREDNETIEDENGNVIGIIKNNGSRIEWTNKSVWSR